MVKTLSDSDIITTNFIAVTSFYASYYSAIKFVIW